MQCTLRVFATLHTCAFIVPLSPALPYYLQSVVATYVVWVGPPTWPVTGWMCTVELLPAVCQKVSGNVSFDYCHRDGRGAESHGGITAEEPNRRQD